MRVGIPHLSTLLRQHLNFLSDKTYRSHCTLQTTVIIKFRHAFVTNQSPTKKSLELSVPVERIIAILMSNDTVTLLRKPWHHLILSVYTIALSIFKSKLGITYIIVIEQSIILFLFQIIHSYSALRIDSRL